MENKASWHRKCQQKFNHSKLTRAKRKYEKVEKYEEGNSETHNTDAYLSDGRRSKRQSTEKSIDIRLFCGIVTDNQILHDFTCYRIDKKSD